MVVRGIGKVVVAATFILVGCNKPDFAAEQRAGPARVSSPSPSPSPAAAIVQNQQNQQNNAAGNGGNNNDTIQGNVQNAQGYSLTCKDPQPRRETLIGKPGTSVVLKGEICPSSFGRLTVLFVVDFSGSMDENDPRSLLLNCGRLKAANAIVKKIEKDMTDKDDVRIGLVSFGNTAELAESIVSLKDFKSNLNTFELCGSSKGATNYRAAFEQSRINLNGIDGNKLIYFISDGLPTLGGDGPQDNNDAGGKHKQAGFQAMQALQQNSPNLTVNAVFLNKGQTGQAEFDYLAQLTGAASRVRVASNADQLAEKVVDLSIPRAILNEQQTTAFVETVASGRKPVPLSRFVKDPIREGVWLFETAPVPMTAAPGVETTNTIVVSAPDRNSTPYNSSMIVNFRPN